MILLLLTSVIALAAVQANPTVTWKPMTPAPDYDGVITVECVYIYVPGHYVHTITLAGANGHDPADTDYKDLAVVKRHNDGTANPTVLEGGQGLNATLSGAYGQNQSSLRMRWPYPTIDKTFRCIFVVSVGNYFNNYKGVIKVKGHVKIVKVVKKDDIIKKLIKRIEILEKLVAKLTVLVEKLVKKNDKHDYRIKVIGGPFIKKEWKGKDHHYLVTKKPEKYAPDQAYDICKEYGGYPVELDTKDEFDFILKLLGEIGGDTDNYFTGMQRDTVGSWVGRHNRKRLGSKVPYVTRDPYDTTPRIGKCLIIHKAKKGIDIVKCDLVGKYICEIPYKY